MRAATFPPSAYANFRSTTCSSTIRLPRACGARLVPKAVRTKVRQFFSMTDRPTLSEKTRQDLEKTFDADLAILGGWLGTDLNCGNFCTATSATSLNWR